MRARECAGLTRVEIRHIATGARLVHFITRNDTPVESFLKVLESSEKRGRKEVSLLENSWLLDTVSSSDAIQKNTDRTATHNQGCFTIMTAYGRDFGPVPFVS